MAYRREYPDYPWYIRCNQRTVCVYARAYSEVTHIIRQLQKIHRIAQFDVRYNGERIAYCVNELGGSTSNE